MFSHSARDLSAIRFHSLVAVMLTTIGVIVCPIVHIASTLRRTTRHARSPIFSTALGTTGRTAKEGPVAAKVTRVEGAEIVDTRRVQ